MLCNTESETLVHGLSIAEERAIYRFWERLSAQLGRQVSRDEARAIWERDYAEAWRIKYLAHVMRIQREEMLRHKWIESEKAHRDLGNEAIWDWINKYAASFRDWYEQYGELVEV